MTKSTERHESRKPHVAMRRLAVSFVAIAAVFSVTQIGFAYSNAYTRLQNEKQLLVDGDMEAADTSAWTGAGGAIVSKVTASPAEGSRHIRVTTATTGNPMATQDVLTIGKTYRISGMVKNSGAAYATVNAGPTVNAYITTTSGWEKFSVVATAGGGTQLQLICAGVTAPNYCEWDRIFVSEYVGSTRDNEKQILADGDMEASGTASWSIGNATVTKQTSGQKSGKQSLRAAYDGSHSSGGVTQTVLTIGKTYRIRGFARTGGPGSPYPAMIASGVFQWSGSTSSAWQPFDVTFVCSTNGVIYFYGYGLETGSYVEFDDIFVTEYFGRTNDIEKQVVTDGDMEKTGTTDWTPFASSVSKETADPKSGRRVLRIPAAAFFVRQTALTTGKRYRVTGWARSGGNSKPAVGDNLNGYRCVIGTTSTEWQRIDCTMTAGDPAFVLDQTPYNDYVEFDDIFVTALP